MPGTLPVERRSLWGLVKEAGHYTAHDQTDAGRLLTRDTDLQTIDVESLQVIIPGD